NPSVVFPLDVAIDSSEIIGIDFDETLHTGNYTESITINTLGGRHDIVHSVTIDDTTSEAIVSFNGDLTTVGGVRYLVNSEGDDVESTTDQMLLFNGTSDFVVYADDLVVDLRSNFTLRVDFTHDSTQRETAYVAYIGHINNYRAFIDPDNVLFVGAGSAGTIDTGYIVDDGKHTLHLTYTSTTVYCYVDSALVSETPFIPSTDTVKLRLRLGVYVDELQHFFKGSLGNVQLWNNYFTQEDVTFDFLSPEQQLQLVLGVVSTNSIRFTLEALTSFSITEPTPPTITGTTYYADADASGAGDGTSEADAFTTLSAIQSQTLNAGDGVLFKKGTVFSGERIELLYSGTSEAPIVYGTYGTGLRPLIDSSEEFAFTWVDNTDGTWTSTNFPNSSSPSRIWRNGAEQLVKGAGETLGDTIPDTVSWSWDDVADEITVLGDPTSDTFRINRLTWSMMAEAQTNVHIHGLEVKGGWYYTTETRQCNDFKLTYCKLGRDSTQGSYFNDASNFIVDNCEFDANWNLDYSGGGIDSDSSRGIDEGCQFTGTGSNNKVIGSYFNGWHHSGLYIYAKTADGDISSLNQLLGNKFESPTIPYGNRISLLGDVRNTTVSRNIMTNMQGGRVQVEGTDNVLSFNIFEHMYDSPIKTVGSEGFAIRAGDWEGLCSGLLVENNVFFDIKSGAISLGGTGTFSGGRGFENATIQNNIFLECNTATIDQGVPIHFVSNDLTATRLITIKNNIAHDDIETDFIYYGSRMDIATATTTLNADGHTMLDNINGDPLFTDAINGNYRLNSNSNAIGSGVIPISDTEDYEQNPIGSSYNIGALGENTTLGASVVTWSPILEGSGVLINDLAHDVTTACQDSWTVKGGNRGLQKIASNTDLTKANTMGFDATQASQIVIAVPSTAHSALEVIGGVNHLYTNDTVGGLHYYIGTVEQAVPTEIVGFFDMNDVSEISGLAVSERELFEVYDGIKVAV
ncbi:MAG: hypothetical protein DRH37_09530, partial [Deltaproteobacteria bacterium]